MKRLSLPGGGDAQGDPDEFTAAVWHCCPAAVAGLAPTLTRHAVGYQNATGQRRPKAGMPSMSWPGSDAVPTLR